MFIVTEDFSDIIEKASGKGRPISLTVIPTGWTNIVFEAEMPDGRYFFRFPRDKFWTEIMAKDVAFCNYVHGRTSFATPKSTLLRDSAGRPFSMYKKIDGTALQFVFLEMGPEQIERTAKDIAKFINEISVLPVGDMPPACKMLSSDFFTQLSQTYFGNVADEYYGRLLHAEKKNPVTIHGDMTPANILIDDDGNVTGIIDLSFAGIGGDLVDLSRIIGRVPPALGTAITTAMARDIDMDELMSLVDVFRYLEIEYLKHIKNNCPEIILPPGL